MNYEKEAPRHSLFSTFIRQLLSIMCTNIPQSAQQLLLLHWKIFIIFCSVQLYTRNGAKTDNTRRKNRSILCVETSDSCT